MDCPVDKPERGKMFYNHYRDIYLPHAMYLSWILWNIIGNFIPNPKPQISFSIIFEP